MISLIALRLEMHSSTDAEPVGLTQVLELFELERIEWRLVELYGTAASGSHLNVLELEHRIRAADGGIRYTSRELVDLAASPDQVIDCELQGRLLNDAVSIDEGPAIRLSAFDSTLSRAGFSRGSELTRRR